MVYEGARSVTGPLLASLGASAVLVGLISGAGEATALLLRLVFGSWADRSGRYWTLTFVGYGLTAVCVPALAITPFSPAPGWSLACVLILGERLGRRSAAPPKLLCSLTRRLRSDWDAASACTRRLIRSERSRPAPGGCRGRGGRNHLASHGGVDHSRSGGHAHVDSNLAQHGQSRITTRPGSIGGWCKTSAIRGGAARRGPIKQSAAACVLAICGRLRGNERRLGHLRRDCLPPHPRSCCVHRSRSGDLCGSDGRRGAGRPRVRLVVRSDQGRCSVGAATAGLGSAGVGVRLISTAGAYAGLVPGAEGTVALIDDSGTVDVRWDSGEELALVVGQDFWRTMPAAA